MITGRINQVAANKCFFSSIVLTKEIDLMWKIKVFCWKGGQGAWTINSGEDN